MSTVEKEVVKKECRLSLLLGWFDIQSPYFMPNKISYNTINNQI